MITRKLFSILLTLALVALLVKAAPRPMPLDDDNDDKEESDEEAPTSENAKVTEDENNDQSSEASNEQESDNVNEDGAEENPEGRATVHRSCTYLGKKVEHGLNADKDDCGRLECKDGALFYYPVGHATGCTGHIALPTPYGYHGYADIDRVHGLGRVVGHTGLGWGGWGGHGIVGGHTGWGRHGWGYGGWRGHGAWGGHHVGHVVHHGVRGADVTYGPVPPADNVGHDIGVAHHGCGHHAVVAHGHHGYGGYGCGHHSLPVHEIVPDPHVSTHVVHGHHGYHGHRYGLHGYGYGHGLHGYGYGHGYGHVLH